MENMIEADEWLWINKVSYGAVLPKRWADIPLINVFTWIYSLRKADEWNDWGYHRLPKIANPKRSDIVVFKDPENQYFLLVKRLIAQPGDQIEIRNGHLILNNSPLKDPLTVSPTLEKDTLLMAGYPKGTAWNVHNYGPIIIPGKGMVLELNDNAYEYLWLVIQREGHEIIRIDGQIWLDGKIITSYSFEKNYYFMLGDNRGNSKDSRFWGFVCEEDIIGKGMKSNLLSWIMNIFRKQ